MKNLMRIPLTAALVSFSLLTFAQNKNAVTYEPAPKIPIDSITGLFSYTEVVKVPNTTKDDLYKRCIEWTNSFYTNAQDVTKVRDQASGIISGAAKFKIYDINQKDPSLKTDAGVIQYDLKFEFKDNRYRYTFTKYNLKAQSYSPIEKWLDKKAQSYQPRYESFLTQVDAYTKDLIAKMKKTMAKAPAVKNDNW
ncbi:MAG: DUF4468 domain-containing protein [Bacteroidota bacterium]